MSDKKMSAVPYGTFNCVVLIQQAVIKSMLSASVQWRINEGATGARVPGPRAPEAPFKFEMPKKKLHKCF